MNKPTQIEQVLEIEHFSSISSLKKVLPSAYREIFCAPYLRNDKSIPNSLE